MSEMVERVARAMCAHMEIDPDRSFQRYNSDGTLKPLAPTWKSYVLLARAAIEAMREPTEAMGISGSYHVTMAEGALTTSQEDAECAWRAMIDEAFES